MIAKFFLIVYIGKFLSVNELGEYGLFVTTITLAVFFLGFDFYTYNTREILSRPVDNALPLIRDQLVFHLLVYIVILPILLGVFFFDIISFKYIGYFYLVLIFEHLGQEFFRLFITLQKPLFANLLLFFRAGFWIYIVVLLWHFGVKGIVNLNSVWTGWIIGAILSVLIGMVYLYLYFDFNTIFVDIDWKWIKRGLFISFPFFTGTLAYKVIEFSNRYIIDYYMTKSDVGVFTFFGSLANVIQTIVYTVVIMVYYPKLVILHNKDDVFNFKKTTNIFLLKVVLWSLFSIIGIVIFIHPMLGYLNKTEFNTYLPVLWLLLGSVFLLNLSFIPHYLLYVQKKDIVIRNITLFSAGVNIMFNFILIRYWGLIGAALSNIISFIIMLGLKYFYYEKNRQAASSYLNQ